MDAYPKAALEREGRGRSENPGVLCIFNPGSGDRAGSGSGLGPAGPRGKHSRIMGYFNHEIHGTHESNPLRMVRMGVTH